jgi:hypothetical protein
MSNKQTVSILKITLKLHVSVTAVVRIFYTIWLDLNKNCGWKCGYRSNSMVVILKTKFGCGGNWVILCMWDSCTGMSFVWERKWASWSCKVSEELPGRRAGTQGHGCKLTQGSACTQLICWYVPYYTVRLDLTKNFPFHNSVDSQHKHAHRH